MLITCINNKCLYEWDYKGKSKTYICCPKCSYRFKIQRGVDNKEKTMLKKEETMLTYSHNIVKKEPQKIDFVEVEPHIFVERKIAKQFQDANEEELIEEPEIKTIPYKTPLEIIEHQRNFF